ncbi:cupin 2 domain-containing protein [Caballeronia cordobensis]|uniref:Cupin 2 domain-containing protein n=1 Tax=Caballeronia cordobensis TaxID=1353886 RepID=A0A158ITU9_CABCO|nr:cupin domain-containing protein [Caballeronia cordobensis]SAL59703.1 cupin 2 domain-containing protein [Caballeronia cordobensis]
MKTKRILLPLLVAMGLALAEVSVAADNAGDSVKPNFSHAIPNIPGKSLVAVEVSYPPGGASMSHRHAHSAFIYAYVVSGQVVSQVEGQPARTYKAGEAFYEDPGAHHLVSRNASQTEPAKLLAVFVVETKDTALTTMDK